VIAAATAREALFARLVRLARLATAVLGLAAIAAWPSLPPNGPVLLEVLSPAAGATVDLRGIEVLVRFASEDAAPETFRALLNGADVSEQLTTGENGSYGKLLELLPGENVLRLEVFGRVPWNRDHLFEQSRELRIRMRPPTDLDRG
jgi:hypothetical protein